MASSVEESEKYARIDKIHANNFQLVKKIVKIGPIDRELIWLKLKKNKKEGKIYNPVGKFEVSCGETIRAPYRWQFDRGIPCKSQLAQSCCRTA